MQLSPSPVTSELEVKLANLKEIQNAGFFSGHIWNKLAHTLYNCSETKIQNVWSARFHNTKKQPFDSSNEANTSVFSPPTQKVYTLKSLANL